MEEGWIKIYPQRLLGWEWYDNPDMFRLFMHLLLKANYKDKQWHGITIRRGQLVTSLVNLSTETGLSLQTVRTCLARLTSTGEVNKQVTHSYTLLTICKYDKYQQGQQGNQHTTNTPLTHEQHTNNTPLTTTSDSKNNIKKDKLKTSTNVDAKSLSFVVPEFAEVFSMWLEYKVQRRETYKSELSLKKCYNRLVRLSGGDPATAKAIVEESMANNWAGTYALKENDNGNNPQQQAPVAGRLPGQAEGKNPLAGYDKIIHA